MIAKNSINKNVYLMLHNTQVIYSCHELILQTHHIRVTPDSDKLTKHRVQSKWGKHTLPLTPLYTDQWSTLDITNPRIVKKTWHTISTQSILNPFISKSIQPSSKWAKVQRVMARNTIEQKRTVALMGLQIIVSFQTDTIY